MDKKNSFTFIDFMRNCSTFSKKNLQEYAKEHRKITKNIDETIASIRKEREVIKNDPSD